MRIVRLIRLFKSCGSATDLYSAVRLQDLEGLALCSISTAPCAVSKDGILQGWIWCRDFSAVMDLVPLTPFSGLVDRALGVTVLQRGDRAEMIDSTYYCVWFPQRMDLTCHEFLACVYSERWMFSVVDFTHDLLCGVWV